MNQLYHNPAAIVPGSIGALAQQNHLSLAESFLNVDAVILVDVSGSMACTDARGGRSRYDVALEELAKLQQHMPGKLGIIAFSNGVTFVPGGQPVFNGGGTNLAEALSFARVADVPGMRFVVISDGEPDDAHEALRIAATYQARIDTVYVGPEGGPGWQFLAQLAKRKGGSSVTAAKAQELAANTERLLLGA